MRIVSDRLDSPLGSPALTRKVEALIDSGRRLLQSSSSQLTDGHGDLPFGAWGKVVTGVPVQVQTRIKLTSRRVLEEAFIAG